MAASKKTNAKSKENDTQKNKTGNKGRNTKNSKGKKGKQQRNIGFREILGIFIIIVALVSLTMLITSGSGAFLRLIRGISGTFSYVTCFVLLWVGILVTFNGRRRMDRVRVFEIACGVVMLYAIVHLFEAESILADTMMGKGFLSFVQASFLTQKGTGAIGSILTYPIYLYLGKWGGLALLILAIGADIVLLCNISLQNVGDSARDTVSRSMDDMKEKRDASQLKRNEKKLKKAEEQRKRREEMAAALAEEEALRQQQEAAEAESGSDELTDNLDEEDDDEAEDEPIFKIPDYLKKKIRKKSIAIDEKSESAAKIIDFDADQPKPKKKKAAPKKKPVFVYEETAQEEAELTEEEPTDIPVYGEETIDEVIEPEEEPEEEIEEEIIRDIPREEPEEEPDEEPENDLGFVAADMNEDTPEEEEEDEEEADYTDGFFSDPFTSPKTSKRAARELEVPEEKKTPAPSHAETTEAKAEKEYSQMLENAADPVEEYNYPPIGLLYQGVNHNIVSSTDDEKKAQKIIDTLASFNIEVTLRHISHGPAVTRFELVPARGIRVNKIVNYVDDIAMALAAESVRIEAPIPGQSAVGVEIPNDEVETVPLRNVLESKEVVGHSSRIAVAIGMDNAGKSIVGDIARMPHVLIAGATGSGKSVCINCMICSILYRAKPEEVRMIMIDPKQVELSVYNDIPHLLVPVVTDPKKAAGALNLAVIEMESRYRKFADNGVRDIKGYNKHCAATGEAMMSQIVIIVDELADLMMTARKDVESAICRLAQLARAAGMHLVVATQRPSVDVITGLIKANIPSRIAFKVTSQVDSRTILDISGAEKLVGKGDMLFAPVGQRMQRVQGAWVSDDEIAAVVDYIKQAGTAEYDESITEYMNTKAAEQDAQQESTDDDCDDDPLFAQAVEVAVNAGQVSTTVLQRKLKIGYARAARIMDAMTEKGYISESEGAKPRNVLISRERFLEEFKG